MCRPAARLAFALVLLGSLACDRGSEPPQNPEPALASAEQAHAPAPSQPETTATVELTLPEVPAESPERTPEQIRELHQQYRVLLREARAKREVNQLDAALADYRALLEIDPTDPTALGELAEVAVALTHFELAEAALTRALRYARDDAAKQRLMIQLGGVAEARGQLEGAATHWRAALALREDRDLRARLNRLSIDCSAESCQGLSTLGEAFSTLNQACRRAIEVTSGCEQNDDCEELDEEALDEACTPPIQVDGGALVFDHELGYHYVFPVVRTPLGWTLFVQIAEVIEPGVYGLSAEYDISDALHVVSGTPKRTYHVIDYDVTNNDANMGEDTHQSERESGVVLCRVDGLRALCTDVFVYARHSSFCNVGTGDCEYDDEQLGGFDLKGSTLIIRMDKRKAEKYAIEEYLAREPP